MGRVARQGTKLPRHACDDVPIDCQECGLPRWRKFRAELMNDVGTAADIGLVVEDGVAEQHHVSG